MTDEKLGVCIIGCGYMGGIHAECWQENPDVKIVGVVDVDKIRSDRMANQYRLDYSFSHYLDIIGSDAVDIVSVCIPTCYHAEVTIAAVEAKKHVLCEKPIALSIEDGDRMIDIPDEP